MAEEGEKKEKCGGFRSHLLIEEIMCITPGVGGISAPLKINGISEALTSEVREAEE